MLAALAVPAIVTIACLIAANRRRMYWPITVSGGIWAVFGLGAIINQPGLATPDDFTAAVISAAAAVWLLNKTWQKRNDPAWKWNRPPLRGNPPA